MSITMFQYVIGLLLNLGSIEIECKMLWEVIACKSFKQSTLIDLQVNCAQGSGPCTALAHAHV